MDRAKLYIFLQNNYGKHMHNHDSSIQSCIYYPQRLIFQNTSSPRNLQQFPRSDNKTFAKVTQLAGGNFARGAQVQNGRQSKPMQS